MIPERFWVKGRRNDNNDWVVGYFSFLPSTYPGDHDHFYITEAELRDPRKGRITFAIRPGTVEPIALPVEQYDAEAMTGLCPNCKAIQDEIQGCPAYCKYCGQRLDWNAEAKL